MTGGTHVAIANFSYLALGLVGQRYGWELPVDWTHIAVVSLWGVLPDIDNSTAWMGKQIPLVGQLLERRLGRRGWTHTVWAAVGTSLLWLVFSPTLMIAALVGYSSHLLSDGLTRPGLQPWRPLGRVGGVMLFSGGGFWDVVIGMTAIMGSWICLIHRVGSAAARAIEDPLAWGLVLALVALVPGWLLSTTIRRI